MGHTFRPGARGRSAGLRRILQVWQRIEGRRFRPATRLLAEEFQVHWRTIHRDLALLEELHFAVPPEAPAYFADAEYTGHEGSGAIRPRIRRRLHA